MLTPMLTPMLSDSILNCSSAATYLIFMFQLKTLRWFLLTQMGFASHTYLWRRLSRVCVRGAV